VRIVFVQLERAQLELGELGQGRPLAERRKRAPRGAPGVVSESAIVNACQPG
jgi:hypothetical protein